MYLNRFDPHESDIEHAVEGEAHQVEGEEVEVETDDTVKQRARVREYQG